MNQLPAGEITFVFTDIEGSTRLFHRLGDRYQETLSTHRRLVREAFTQHGGVEVSDEGDAFFFVFTDEAEAASATVRAHAVLASAEWPDNVAVRIRIGMHTGNATPVGEDYVALPVHLAARVAAVANGGQTLASGVTADRLSDWSGGAVERLGRFWLKDFDEPVVLHALMPVGGRSDASALPRARRADVQIPLAPPGVVGREDDLRALRKLIASERIVTIVGAGGMGKTTLALAAANEVASSFTGGAWFVDLSGVDTDAAALALAAKTLGAPPEVAEGPMAQVRQLLDGGGSALVILDNCEHVVSAASELASTVIEVSPTSVVVATSRQPLRVAAQRVHRLGGLDLPSGRDEASVSSSPAVRLFIERAEAAGATLRRSSEELRAIVDICSQLDGMPLAIELAAARAPVLPPDELRDRLGTGVSLLRRGRDATDRQSTLDAVIAWSYALLDDEERALLRALSIFPSAASLGFVVAVSPSGDEVATLDLLGSLLDKSLVVRSDDAEGSRFGLLGTIRQYASSLLSSDDEEAALVRLAGAVLAEATRHDDTAQLVLRLQPDRAAARRAAMFAVESRRVELVVALTNALAEAWDQWGDWELYEPLCGALQQQPMETEEYAAAAASAAWLAGRAGDYRRAGSLATQAVPVARGADTLARLHHVLALAELRVGSLDEARRHAAIAVEQHRTAGNASSVAAITFNVLGMIERKAGNIDRARATFADGIDATAEMPTIRALVLQNLGDVLLACGDLAGAATALEQAVDLRRQLGSVPFLAHSLATMSVVDALAGRTDAAAETLEELEALGVPSTARTWHALARMELATSKGQWDEAGQLLDELEAMSPAGTVEALAASARARIRAEALKQ